MAFFTRNLPRANPLVALIDVLMLGNKVEEQQADDECPKPTSVHCPLHKNILRMSTEEKTGTNRRGVCVCVSFLPSKIIIGILCLLRDG